MPQGLQIWDAAGNLMVDVSTRLTRVMGATETGTSAGSVTNADLAQGSVWWALVPKGTTYGFTPSVSYDSSTFTLSWAASGGAFVNCLLIYGVY